MTENNAYYCYDCDQYFGSIPAFGCPCCGSENYYPTNEIETETELTAITTAKEIVNENHQTCRA